MKGHLAFYVAFVLFHSRHGECYVHESVLTKRNFDSAAPHRDRVTFVCTFYLVSTTEWCDCCEYSAAGIALLCPMCQSPKAQKLASICFHLRCALAV